MSAFTVTATGSIRTAAAATPNAAHADPPSTASDLDAVAPTVATAANVATPFAASQKRKEGPNPTQEKKRRDRALRALIMQSSAW
jgi:hypothetical protein